MVKSGEGVISSNYNIGATLYRSYCYQRYDLQRRQKTQPQVAAKQEGCKNCKGTATRNSGCCQGRMNLLYGQHCVGSCKEREEISI